VLSTTGGLGHRRILRDPYVVRAATAFVTERLPGVLAAAWEDAERERGAPHLTPS